MLGLEATAANLAGVPLPTLIEAQTVIPDALASQPNPARFGASIVVSAMPLAGWAREVARLLQPSGHLFVYEAHPAVILWTWDEDRPRIREDRSYFGGSHVNDTFPGRGAVEWQWTLGEIITAVAAAGMEILHLGEYPEPFWRAGGISAAAWSGRLPNSFALLARRAQ